MSESLNEIDFGICNFCHTHVSLVFVANYNCGLWRLESTYKVIEVDYKKTLAKTIAINGTISMAHPFCHIFV